MGFSYCAIIANDKNVHAHGLTSSVGGCAVGSASERDVWGLPSGVGSAGSLGLAVEQVRPRGGAGALGGLASCHQQTTFRARRAPSSARCRAAFGASCRAAMGRRRHLCCDRRSGACAAGAVSGVTERWERTRTPLTSRVNQELVLHVPSNSRCGLMSVDAAGGPVDGNGTGKAGRTRRSR